MGNRIEARQWIVARHLSCYNPLSYFTSFCGVKHDKIKFHEFFSVCNFFSFSHVSLSLSLSLSLSSTPASLSLSRSCLSFYPSLSIPVSFSFSSSRLSFYLSLSYPCRLLLLIPLMSPYFYLSLTPVSSSPSLSLSLSVSVSVSFVVISEGFVLS